LTTPTTTDAQQSTPQRTHRTQGARLQSHHAAVLRVPLQYQERERRRVPRRLLQRERPAAPRAPRRAARHAHRAVRAVRQRLRALYVRRKALVAREVPCNPPARRVRSPRGPLRSSPRALKPAVARLRAVADLQRRPPPRALVRRGDEGRGATPPSPLVLSGLAASLTPY